MENTRLNRIIEPLVNLFLREEGESDNIFSLAIAHLVASDKECVDNYTRIIENFDNDCLSREDYILVSKLEFMTDYKIVELSQLNSIFRGKEDTFNGILSAIELCQSFELKRHYDNVVNNSKTYRTLTTSI